MDFHLDNDNWSQMDSQMDSFERFSPPESTSKREKATKDLLDFADRDYSLHSTKMPTVSDVKEEVPRQDTAAVMEEAEKDMDGMDGINLPWEAVMA